MSRNRGIRPAVFALGAVGLAILFALVYLVAVRTRTGQMLDERAFDGARLGQRSLAPVTLSFLDALPLATVAAALLIAVVISAVRGTWVTFLVAIIAAFSANLVTQILKDLVLARPDLGVHGYAFNSLPSGHTTLAASASLLVFLAASPSTRPMVAALGALFTIGTGVATLANQWHRPSDVVAALLVVGFCGCLAGAVLTRLQPHRQPAATSSWNSALRVVALVSVVVAALAYAASALQSGAQPFSLPMAYIGGIAGISAVGCLLASAASSTFRTFR